MTDPTPIVPTIGSGATKARAWICDIWGVLHNGVTAHRGPVEACRAFRRDGGRIVLVTNAPRPSSSVVNQLEALKIERDAYDAILTSGDVTRIQLKSWQGKPTLHIGPERDRVLFDNQNVPRVSALDAATRILCSGLYDDTIETPEHYRKILTPLAARKIPMLCANPDLKVDRGGKIIYCAGAIAQLYETLGGQVAYAGKPHTPIYTAARNILAKTAGSPIPDTDILAIGDGVLTDIPGGIAAGFRTVYIASAIHLDEALTSDSVAKLFSAPHSRPTVALNELAYRTD